MFHPVQSLFGNREDNLAILHDGRRRIGMKHIEAKNQHDYPEVPIMEQTRDYLTMTGITIDSIVDKKLLQLLVCPRDHEPLDERHQRLVCPRGHSYPIVEGIPVLLLSETPQTHVEGTRSLEIAATSCVRGAPPCEPPGREIDPFVQEMIAATNGCLYIPLIGKLREYPIPDLRLPRGEGKLFLEIGCHWGRWCVAAARRGYYPVGIDPSLNGIRSARKVARQLGVEAQYAVADGRYLPFAARTFDKVFSYSVLQHLSRENVRLVLQEASRVMILQGTCLVQMPNRFGIRCLYHQARRGFREGRNFEVRYWTPAELTSTFGSIFGSARVFADGFFSLNSQISDVRFLPRKYRAIVYASEALRAVSRRFPSLTYLADSLYVSAGFKGGVAGDDGVSANNHGTA